MMTKVNSRRGGFTLVEIMIVVAIIALLAAIAVPSALRARKRSQATSTLQTLRILDAACDQFAIENGKKPGDDAAAANLLKYVKAGSKLYTDLAGGKALDAMNREISLPLKVDTAPKVPTDTKSDLAGVIDDPAAFWGAFN